MFVTLVKNNVYDLVIHKSVFGRVYLIQVDEGDIVVFEVEKYVPDFQEVMDFLNSRFSPTGGIHVCPPGVLPISPEVLGRLQEISDNVADLVKIPDHKRTLEELRNYLQEGLTILEGELK